MKNKIIIFVTVIGILLGGTFGYVLAHVGSSSKSKVLSAQTTRIVKPISSPSPTVTPGIPETISIPKINVNTKVESVAQDSQGRMDVPKNPMDTAWYSPGFRPGMNGSSVIDGHLDLVTGAPAAFWNLKELVPGDTISVTENNGKIYTFVVSEVTKYPYNNFPLKQVFAASDVPMLNLITCNGVWDKNTRNYSDRLVVYSKLIAEK
jgi:sortase A